MARKFVITSAVADLRKEPQEILKKDYSHQEMRQSQLLFAEKVEVMKSQGDWLHILALEQPYFDEEHGWRPYAGWIHRSEARAVDEFKLPTHVVYANTTAFSYGTLLTEPFNHSSSIRALPKIPIREAIVEEALRFVGLPYLWGGRAYQLESAISSVDCSGLVNLLYRAQGLIIPRNAHDQYLKSKPTPHLKPADPLYLSKEKRITHVILKLDNTTFIEAPETGKNVRLLSWGKDIWERAGKIHFFDRPHAYIPYLATFLTF